MVAVALPAGTAVTVSILVDLPRHRVIANQLHDQANDEKQSIEHQAENDTRIDPAKHVPDEIYLSYGPYFVSRCSTIDFQQPVNIFAQIESNLEELKEIGTRILMQGAELVSFQLAQED